MRELTQRAGFSLCSGLGRVLRAGTYARTRVVDRDGVREVRKQRRFYAPVLVWMGGPLTRVLGVGVHVLARHDWEERERGLYHALHGASIRIDDDGTLVLPFLAGETLATLLDDPSRGEAVRAHAIRLAVFALAAFHARGFTHGDAMAENVMIDLGSGDAHWFDFETVHDATRPLLWRRADDVRALLATCLLRTAPGQFAETLRLMLDAYADEGVTALVAMSFTSALQRPLVFHLGQAGLSYERFRETARLLSARLAG